MILGGYCHLAWVDTTHATTTKASTMWRGLRLEDDSKCTLVVVAYRYGWKSPCAATDWPTLA